MKKSLILSFVFFSCYAFSQDASVEKSIYGVQLGILDLNVHNETKLQRAIALRTEIGLSLLFISVNNNTFEKKTSSLIVPYITLEPKWYYNLARRARLGKYTKKNSSNYFSLKTSYIAANTPLIETGNINVVSAFQAIPKFGIRRNVAKHFNYEFSGGAGYYYNIFSNDKGCLCNHNSYSIDLQARIGYVF